MKKITRLLPAFQAAIVLSVLFVLSGHTVYAQCCLTNQLIINTGYDPNTGTAVAPGSSDPLWRITALSPACMAVPGGSGVGANANVINPSAWSVIGTDGNYISFFPGCCFTDPTGGVYQMTMTRCFTLCQIAIVTINLNSVFADDYVITADVDGLPIGTATFAPPYTPGRDMVTGGRHPASVSYVLSAAPHCINIKVGNVPFPGGLVGYGLAVFGNVSTTALVIEKENAACTTGNICEEPHIHGPQQVCVNSTITLTDSLTGGTWTSGNTSVATVGASSGVVTGVSGGTVTISYTDPCLRTTPYTVTVNPLPKVINGPTHVCIGSTITLTDTVTGGTWTSSMPSHGTIGSGTGIVTGVGAGTTLISYTLSTGCARTTIVTVDALPTITGNTPVCIGNSITLSGGIPTGGTWVSGNTGVATVGSSSGIVTGVASGTVAITYTNTLGCTNKTIVTVNPLPKIITGPTHVCIGSTITLSDTVTGGTWTSSIPSHGVIGASTGIVTGEGAGTTLISYTLPTGCMRTIVVTVDALPTITGNAPMCVGNSITLSSAPTGGTWSTASSLASVTSGGIATGVAAGFPVITYTDLSGCIQTATLTVNPLPSVITGNMPLCPGTTIALHDSVSGGSWSTASSGTATVDGAGIVTGTGSGTGTITYTLPGTGCMVTAIVTVNSLPAAITGTLSVCVGASTSLSDATIGGSWSTDGSGVATVDAAGVVTGHSSGTATVTYTNASGCIATAVVTVNPNPTITSPNSICKNLYVNISATPATPPGGIWNTSPTGIVSVSPITYGLAGLHGLTPGTTTISYTISTGCYATHTITVLPLPDPISGPSIVCIGSTITLTDATAGGGWGSTNSAAAPIGSSSGVVTGVTAGSVTTIYYTNTLGCSVTKTISVYPLSPPITGTVSICAGSTTTLTESGAAGGTWSSSDPTKATIGAGVGTMGVVVNGIAAGTSTISYTGDFGCGLQSTTTNVTVYASPAAITGTLNTCVGGDVLLSETSEGGTWSTTAGNVFIFDFPPAYEAVYGISAGTAVITYSLAGGCQTTVVVTVTPLPDPITGTFSLCMGDVTTLADATVGGGTWLGSPPSVATVGLTDGVVTTVSVGTFNVVYISNVTECTVSKTITVNPLPGAITGTLTVCTGSITSLSNSLTGGTWSSSAAGTASVSSTGIVSGLTTGTAVITYTSDAGCMTTAVVTVNASPGSITGITTICVGSSASLSDGSAGGSWSSGSPGIADINSSTGVITGIAEGTAFISYTLTDGCPSSAVITVNPLPSAITGTLTVCAGLTTTLSDATSPGTWLSDNLSVATVDMSSGIVTGIAAGTATIDYISGAGCNVSTIVTVNTAPAPVTGTLAVCQGLTATLSNAESGGTWSSSAPGTAMIGSSSGILTGVTVGTATITYTLGDGCITMAVITVNPLPSAITGTLTVCEGLTTTLSDDGGGAWTSSDATVTVDPSSGMVSGVTAGTANITYTLGTGCITTTIVTVNQSPASISGTASVCIGLTATLNDDIADGTWSSSASGTAAIDGSGVVTGVTEGMATITYRLSDGCAKTIAVTVNPVPSSITSTLTVCAGRTTVLSDATPDGTWSSSDETVAIIDMSSGIVTGEGAGTATITYTLGTGCITTAVVTVSPSPAVISGPNSLCVESTITLTDATADGTWSSSDGTVASIGSTSGIVTGNEAGTAIITYTGTNGCFATLAITVNPLPNAITVATTNICVGNTTTLSVGPPPADGIWTTAGSAASVDPFTGIVTGVDAGTATFTYTLLTGCYRTFGVVTVNPLPDVISASATAICVGATATLTETSTTGTWTSGAPAVASIDPATGVVTGVAGGTVTFTYTLPSGCYRTLGPGTVNPLPGSITGASTVCSGSAITLTGAPSGGTWSSSDVAVATVGSSTGIVTGGSVGAASTVTITYTLGTGCATTKIITVNPIPAAITGTAATCIGLTTTLSDATTGGTWSSSDVGVATVGTSGIVTGGSVAVTSTATISYTLGTGCYVTTVVTVTPLPGSITVPSLLCSGQTITMTDTPPGGTWSSSDVSVATVGSASGIVTENSAGTVTITYSLSNCMATAILTVNIGPDPIMGIDTICQEFTELLTDATPGGTWSSSNPDVCPIAFGSPLPDGIASILGSLSSTGTTTITYSLPDGCASTLDVVVSPQPAFINTTASSICTGTTTTLNVTPAGTWVGTWSCSDPSVAIIGSIGAYSCVVTGVATGTVMISYAFSTGSCLQVTTISVNPPPVDFGSSSITVCPGFSTPTSALAGGGTWTSSNPAVVVVDPVAGTLTALTGGTAILSYTGSTVCGLATTTLNVTVSSAPTISTNFITACQMIPGYDAGTIPVITDPDECILVCEFTSVRYYAHGTPGASYDWTVTGSYSYTNYGDSIDVIWGEAGNTGTVTLYDAFSVCSNTVSICTKSVAKPFAAFSMPDNACIGTNVLIHSANEFTPPSYIASTYWDFGDGAVSASDATDITHSYATAGDYWVRETITNGCGCSDTVGHLIHIIDATAPVIKCPGVVCDSQTAVYFAAETCAEYDWTVTGGHVIAGGGTSDNNITVKWDQILAGFGQVGLTEPSCSACPYPSVAEVPVVEATPDISGPTTVCVKDENEYSFPLWGATQYQWGVIDHPEAIVSISNDYKVVLKFITPGSYLLHGWYQNRITMCGGNVFKKIIVNPHEDVVGDADVCLNGSTETYTLGGGESGTWNVLDSMNNILATGSGASIDYIFTTPGTYYVFAFGGPFCSAPLTVKVYPTPNPPGFIHGARSVCLGQPYGYNAGHFATGSIPHWAATGGTVVPTDGTDSVTVVWTDAGPKTLSVSAESSTAPHCKSTLYSINIDHILVNPHITGDAAPCANAHRDYTANYPDADMYDWTIYPDSVGSIVAGNHANNATVLWNNVPQLTAAFVIATVRRCDSVISDTLAISIQHGVLTTITTIDPNPVCSGSTVTFVVAPAGALSYHWTWGDGASGTVGNDTARHLFLNNTGTGNVVYTVTVDITTAEHACPAVGVATADVTILPGPAVYVSGSTLPVCLPDSIYLSATASTNAGSITSWQWYETGVPADSAVGSGGDSYYATGPGWYYVVATADNGCTGTSALQFAHIKACFGGTTDPPHCVLPVSYTTSCNTFTLTSAGSTGSWTAVSTPLEGAPVGTNPATASYISAGVYWFTFTGTNGDCADAQKLKAYLYVGPSFSHTIKCGVGGNDTITLTDNTTTYGVIPLTISWTMTSPTGGPAIPGGPSAVLVLPAGSTYTFRETVTATVPDPSDPTGVATLPYNCFTDRTIVVPAQPTVSFTYTIDPMPATPLCEGLPVYFYPSVSTHVLTYLWTFGDGSSLERQDSIQRTYTFDPSFPNPNPRKVKFTVTDDQGCIVSDSINLQIHPNILAGDLGSSPQMVCSSDLPVILTYTPGFGTPTPTSYWWSTAETTPTITTDTTGTYFVTVFDGFGCRKTMPVPGKQVQVVRVPVPHISGNANYCVGDVVELSGFTGGSLSYQWLRDGSPVGTDPTLSDGALVAGDYSYQLVVGSVDPATGFTCYETSAVYLVHMHDVPPLPAVTATLLDCGTYHMQLTATEADPGIFNWIGIVGSSPIPSASSTVDVYSGGIYRVQYTNAAGCSSHTDTIMPSSPNAWFPYFATGCYDICTEQAVMLYGPPGVVFDNWAWIKDGSADESGSGTLMDPYLVPGSGTYTWYLDNGLCAETSPAMSMTFAACDACDDVSLRPKISCENTNPGSYNVSIDMGVPDAGTYSFGTDIGPMVPFSGSLPAAGTYHFDFDFTTLYLSPVPDSVVIQLSYTAADGSKCYKNVKMELPSCSWAEERHSRSDSTGGVATLGIANSLLIFPNPSADEVTMSYDYGTDGGKDRSLSVFDEMGRKLQAYSPPVIHGAWTLNVANWTPGVYLVRMEGNGKTLQSQRIIVAH